jgi:hypothetical protein
MVAMGCCAHIPAWKHISHIMLQAGDTGEMSDIVTKLQHRVIDL